MSRGLLLACACVAALMATEAAADSKSARRGKTCDELFEEESLACQTCDFIEKTRPELQGLVTACRECCHGAAEQFVSAVLEIDERYLSWMEEMGSFVEKHAGAFKSFEVKHKPNRRPTLRMKRADGTEDKIAVGGWKADAMRDYLQSKLAQTE